MVRKTFPFLIREPPILRLVPDSSARDASTPRSDIAATIELPLRGQGTVSFALPISKPFRIVVKSARAGRPALVLNVSAKKVTFLERSASGDTETILSSTKRPSARLQPGEGHRYWLSIDKVHRRLRYGKGYAQAHLCRFQYEPPKASGSKDKDPFSWLDDLQSVSLHVTLTVEEAAALQSWVWPRPVTTDLSPLLVGTDAVTLDQIEKGSCAVIQDLGPECQRLYGNVAGMSVGLEPEFIEALRASIADPERACAKRLAAKAMKFGRPSDPKETYLRITVGQNQGNSPGVPYVVEVWPAGHYSPIHSHSDAYAIIKVLHGAITSNYYAELNWDTTKPYAQAKLEKSDVTWLSPEHYQTHKLHNDGNDVCVTIQCYAYGTSDQRHYEFFDYLGKDEKGTNVIGHFLPTADWTWGEFKELILDEYRRLGPLPTPKEPSAALWKGRRFGPADVAAIALATIVVATMASFLLSLVLYLSR